MTKVTAEELESCIENGEEVLDKYFDPSTTRIGKPMQMISRRGEILRMNLDLTKDMAERLDEIAKNVNISRQAVIKMFLFQVLDEHDLAKHKRLHNKEAS